MTETQKYRKSRRVRKFQAQRRKYRRSRFLFFALLGEAVFVGTLVLIGLSLLGALR
ncbi:MAG: hypothetical protein KF821_01985 [Anaerolineales bacterium]|jgi:hypothetical protein|nr:hypothetical protein [Anaerolineales bacterium]